MVTRFAVSIIVCACLVSIVARLTMSERVPFVMDELVDTQIASQIAKGGKLYQDYKWERTPLLNYLIAGTVGSGVDTFFTIISARKVMWAVTVAIFILTYFIARHLLNNYAAIIAITFLASYTTFLDRSFRVRADAVSALLSLPALFILTYPAASYLQLGIAGIFLGFAFLATQKAIYFVIAFAFALLGREYLVYGFGRKYVEEIGKKSLVSSAAFILPIMVFAVWLTITDQFNQFMDNGIMHAAEAGLANTTYKEGTKIFLRQTIGRNPAIWIYGVTGLIMYLLRGLNKTSGVEKCAQTTQKKATYLALALWMLTLLILILNHKVKFPYLYLNIAPSLAICAALPLYSSLRYLNKKPKNVFYYLNIIIVVSTLCYLFIPSIIRHHHNLKSNIITKTQQAIMNRVDNITTTDDSVFDGIGMVVTRKKATPYSMTARWFNERRVGADYDVIGFLKKNEPIVMILNYRIKQLRKDEKLFIIDNFIQDWANVYVVGKRIAHVGPGETRKTVKILASTRYAVLSEYKENIVIDGKKPGSVLYLSAGEHEILIKGASQDLLLKYYKAVANPLPPQKPFKLFPSYRD